MTFDYSKLRGKIVEKYKSQRAFAQAFGVSENVFSSKMSNKVRFTTSDITKIVEMLGIQEREIGEYFFTKEV